MKYLLFLILIFPISNSGFACSCFKATPAELISKAQIIFAGKAISSELNQGKIKTTFELLKVFKGKAQQQEYVFSNDSSAACGINYSVGQSYVILTSENKQVSICNGYDLYYPINVEETDGVGILKELRK